MAEVIARSRMCPHRDYSHGGSSETAKRGGLGSAARRAIGGIIPPGGLCRSGETDPLWAEVAVRVLVLDRGGKL